MLPSNFKLLLALSGAIAAIFLVALGVSIADGTGVVVATLAGGAGWLFREMDRDAQVRRSICQSYAAAIETIYAGFSDSLSDSELNRFLDLAERVKHGADTPTLEVPYEDPVAELPDISSSLHLLHPDTVRYIFEWRDRCQSLQRFYTQLGSKEYCAIPSERLAPWIEWGRSYRDIFKDVSREALIAFKREDQGIEVNLTLFETTRQPECGRG